MNNSDSNDSINKKYLPLGIQSFKDLIIDNYLYADKTKLIQKLISSKKFQYFLARPRRFGKSLLLSTIESLFRGEKELFKDTWIGSNGYEFPQHPVIHLDMMGSSSTPEELKNTIYSKLTTIITKEELNISSNLDFSVLFSTIIQKLYKKYGKKIVLLIDEYDNPISLNLTNPALVEDNLKVLSAFFSPIKPNGGFLRLVFITGVTRFTLAGLSSSLNQLIDLTLQPEFANICGFDGDEFDDLFSERLPETLARLKSVNQNNYPDSFNENDLRDIILNYYDGYSWDGETRALNPYSIIRFFDEAEFNNYWIESGASLTFFKQLAKIKTLKMVDELCQGISRTDLLKMEFNNLQILPLLFQTGYLTVDRTITTVFNKFYFLKVPNLEIKTQFNDLFNDIFTSISSETPAFARENFLKALESGDEAGLTLIVKNIFAGLVAEHHRQNESIYHCGLYCYCFKLAEDVRMEEPGSEGDLDLILVFRNNFYVVIELKYKSKDDDIGKNEEKIQIILNERANTALKSIKEKRYGEKYERKGYKIIDVGLGIYARGHVLAKIRERVF